ncbi:MAG: hypothetical protein IKP47_00910 [Ruminococcus sp.]|nr:hypothetical protein [Ruminococcus sp.]
MTDIKHRGTALVTAFMLVFSLLAFCPETLHEVSAEGSVRIEINEKNFPDTTFRELIKTRDYDLRGDGFIDDEDIFYCRNIYCEGMGITSLKGAEYFTELRGLWCKDNNITSIDISPFKELTGLWCSNNPLTELDLTHNSELLWVYCYDCALTYVDFSQNPNMAFIEINTNPLTGLDVTANPELEHLTCGSCGLTKLDLRNNTKLTHLDAFKNKLTELDLTYNSKLKRLDIWSNTELGNVKVSHLEGLQYYNCAYTGISELNVTNNPELFKLICSYNEITELDLSHNPKLTILLCEDNLIESLDVTHNPKLRILKAALNPFEELDFSNSPYLIKTYTEAEPKQEYIFGDYPVGHSWLIDYGGETSTSGEDPSDRDNVYFIWIDDKVNVSMENPAELPVEEIYSEPDPGVTEKDMVTREQVVKRLYELAGSPDVSGLTSRFTDAVPGSDCYDALLWGEANSICAGYPDFALDTFGVGKFITRQDLMFMLMRYAECTGLKRSIDFGRADDFSDYYEVDYDHWEAVTWAATWLILIGKGDPEAPKEERRIDPYGRATLKEFETMYNRMLEANGIKDRVSFCSKKGDVNSDGAVDVTDLSILARYLAKWPGYAGQVNELNADVDGSGEVTAADYSILARTLARWTGYAEQYGIELS